MTPADARAKFILDLRHKVAEQRNYATTHNNHASSLERQVQASRAEADDYTARADQWQQLLDFAELVDGDPAFAEDFAAALEAASDPYAGMTNADVMDASEMDADGRDAMFALDAADEERNIAAAEADDEFDGGPF